MYDTTTNSILHIYHSNRIDYYTNGEYSVIHYWYKTGELTIKKIENVDLYGNYK